MPLAGCLCAAGRAGRGAGGRAAAGGRGGGAAGGGGNSARPPRAGAGGGGARARYVGGRGGGPPGGRAAGGTRADVGAAIRTLVENPHGPAGQAARQQAAGRLLDLYASALLTAPGHVLQVPDGAGGTVRVRLRRGAGPAGMEPERFVDLEPTSHFTVRSEAGLVQTPGEGVPLAGTLRPMFPVSVPGPVAPQPIEGIVWAVTAVPVARGERALDFDLYDPRVPNSGAARLLAGDYTTPLALNVAHFTPQQRGFRGFTSSKDFASVGIYSTEKPSVDKTPLILVHGLVSSPPDLHSLIVRLERDPWVRAHYQIWFFYYPSSLPVPYSATLLREDTEKFIHQLDPAGTHPALHRAVLVGHSMGGLLSRLTVSDGGDGYYHHFFQKPPEELQLSAADRALMQRTFYYRACPDVARVILIATPHGGSRLAGGLPGKLGRLLVRVPVAVKGRIQRIISTNRAAVTTGTPLKPGSSLDSLTPRDPVIIALRDLPTHAGVGIHSIIGDRGRPGPRERSSDGVVAYTSSHLTWAQSEVVVPAGHSGTLQRPETADEVDRILHLPDPRR